MKVLAVSDVEVDMIYSPLITQRFKDVNLVIGCGDLPYYYLEYIISMLNRPLYYVNGNHAPHNVEAGSGGDREFPWGGVNLHGRVVRDDGTGIIMAGIEGSLAYNSTRFQYTQSDMWWMVFSMVPRLMLNRSIYGRALDIFVTHAPPWQIHDKEDLPHTGIKAFRWLVEVFKPALHLHGHIHIYQQYDITETQHGSTRIINTYGYKHITVDPPIKKRFA